MVAKPLRIKIIEFKRKNFSFIIDKGATIDLPLQSKPVNIVQTNGQTLDVLAKFTPVATPF